MDVKRELSGEELVLSVRLRTRDAVPAARLKALLAALDCRPAEAGRYESRVGSGSDALLRKLARACAAEGGTAWLHAELPPPREGEPYRRLWDRTDDYAAQIAAWHEGKGARPVLVPGELIRL